MDRGVQRVSRRSRVPIVCAALSILVAACGSGGPAHPSDGARAASSAGQRTILFVNPTNVGRVVTLPYGDPVYVDVNERTGSAPACIGACANEWVPVTTELPPKGAVGIEGSGLGTANYKGKKQVTYFGHRLYFFASDHKPLTAGGQGNLKTWFVIVPSGKPLLAS